ncbi:HD domain-containing protein [Paraburkholderia sp. SARCC-3016]|uniref:HD domain-containing protein n=1 Tax=Paraburkholderia sp. SARCC-3016 TaxID=3058611 RepID=UPI002809304A|nr:HD domain-containing protein [Paraburkholderia sp. SARCC-3016]MDQ7982123.1 HD domain-containing protein [Paraburkholderia sp. SARCC-3016]
MIARKDWNLWIPDSHLAREITEFVRDTQSETLFNHSVRVYFWGAMKGEAASMCFDPELLYAAAMFHDIGLTDGYRESQLRFEVDGANAARDFLLSRGFSAQDVSIVWSAVALHTTPGIPEHMHAEIALTQAGAVMDLIGLGKEELTEEQWNAVLTAHPRGKRFKYEMVDAFYEGMKHRPQSTLGTFNDDFLAYKDSGFQRENVCSMILGS